MILYRLARIEYTGSLKASGVPNRWNRERQYVIYTSNNIALCALKLLAHTNGVRPAGTFGLMHIEVKDATIQTIEMADLPKSWHKIAAYHETQRIGDNWYNHKSDLILSVPSVIIPSERNYLINADHMDFSQKVRIQKVDEFFWDSRFPSHS